VEIPVTEDISWKRIGCGIQGREEMIVGGKKDVESIRKIHTTPTQ